MLNIRARFTSTPDPAARDLVCPRCDRPLLDRQTALNGVHPRERWDYFECRRCGFLTTAIARESFGILRNSRFLSLRRSENCDPLRLARTTLVRKNGKAKQ
jgi:hypothetical protein